MPDKYAISRYEDSDGVTLTILSRMEGMAGMFDEIAEFSEDDTDTDGLRVLIAHANENVARQKAEADKAKKEAEEKAAALKRERAKLFDNLLAPTGSAVIDINSLYPSPFYDLDAVRARLNESFNIVKTTAPKPIPRPEDALRQWAAWLQERVTYLIGNTSYATESAYDVYSGLRDRVKTRLELAENDACCAYITTEDLNDFERSCKDGARREVNNAPLYSAAKRERRAAAIGAWKMAGDKLTNIRRGR